MKPSTRALLLGLVFGLVMMAEAQAATLIMIDQRGCPSSARFRREVIPEYTASAAAAVAPLQRITVRRTWPRELSGITPPRYTPYFILVENGEEIGRFGGYSREATFWRRLDGLLARL